MQKFFNNLFQKDFDLPESRWRGVFDYHNQGQSNLLITIGDSWTYGWRLDADKRVQQCYGGLVAKHYGYDFLNLSLPASNNLWMLEKYQQLCANADQISYDKILIVVTLTEFGREFWTDFDHDPELHQLYKQASTARGIAQALANYTAHKFLSCSHPKVELVLGINYVSNIYPKTLLPLQLPSTWLEVLLKQQLKEECITVGSWVIPKFENLQNCNSAVDRTTLLQEMQQMIASAQKRLDLIYNSNYNYKEGYGHPNAEGHAAWANYIVSYYDSTRSLNNECATFSYIYGN